MSFQFLGIPPKGEQDKMNHKQIKLARFQFLGIPPKGEQDFTQEQIDEMLRSFQFLGIPPKGEHWSRS